MVGEFEKRWVVFDTSTQPERRDKELQCGEQLKRIRFQHLGQHCRPSTAPGPV